ncbi:hypothetical protein N5P37_008216, partial [Trichoderma harzianum]
DPVKFRKAFEGKPDKSVTDGFSIQQIPVTGYDGVSKADYLSNKERLIAEFRVPGNKFPTGVEDVCAANLWATALTHRDKPVKHDFQGQILLVPIIMHPATQPADLKFSSYRENAKVPILSAEAIISVPTDLRISPLSADDFSGLPLAYVQVAGADAFKDDGYFAERQKGEAADTG